MHALHRAFQTLIISSRCGGAWSPRVPVKDESAGSSPVTGAHSKTDLSWMDERLFHLGRLTPDSPNGRVLLLQRSCGGSIPPSGTGELWTWTCSTPLTVPCRLRTPSNTRCQR